MSTGMNISAGTIMAYMDLDMSSFNSAIDMAGEQLSGFASGGVAELTVTGRSMEPTLHDRKSRIRLQAAPETLPRGAVVLYKRDNGQYVLHRVAACRGETYDFCGDAQWVLERGLRREQILAVVTEFQRTDRWTSVTSAGYGLYWRALLAIRPLRRFAHRAAGWLRRQVTRERNR